MNRSLPLAALRSQMILSGLLILMPIGPRLQAQFTSAPRTNILMIAVDDLKPAIRAAGDPYAITPNLDRLARTGTIFTRAYCQQAVCSPSRSSVLTGCRPDTTRVYDLATHFRKALPDVVTLPQLFKQQGYFVQGVGKIYHNGYDDPVSWSVPWQGSRGATFGPAGQARMKELQAATGGDVAKISKLRGLPTEMAATDDASLNDGWTANKAIQLLEEFRKKPQPFFLAVGMAKPHLPFVAPQAYWDLYNPEDLPMPDILTPPLGAPEFAPQFGGELRQYDGIPAKGPIDAKWTRQLIHGYYAAISYMDAQVGRILDALDRLKLADSTMVVLWGDHGWHLGDHGIWCKHTNYEEATRSALIVRRPGQRSPGVVCRQLVELVDIYPTLADAAQLPLPKTLEGSSFLPLLDEPTRRWKQAIFTQYPRTTRNPKRSLMGYAIRTESARYVAWRDQADQSLVAEELYHDELNPRESRNLNADPQWASLKQELAQQLKRGWMEHRPTKPATHAP